MTDQPLSERMRIFNNNLNFIFFQQKRKPNLEDIKLINRTIGNWIEELKKEAEK